MFFFRIVHKGFLFFISELYLPEGFLAGFHFICVLRDLFVDVSVVSEELSEGLVVGSAFEFGCEVLGQLLEIVVLFFQRLSGLGIGIGIGDGSLLLL